MAVLIAPMMMFYHSYFVLSVLVGHQVKWEAQAREGRMVPWRVAISKSITMTILALIWAGTTFYYTPSLFLWLLPVLTGMVFAAPIIRLSSSLGFGRLCRRIGIFVIQEELHESPVLVEVRQHMAIFDMDDLNKTAADIPALAKEVPQAMIIQDLSAPPLAKRLSNGDVIAARKHQTKTRHAA